MKNFLLIIFSAFCSFTLAIADNTPLYEDFDVLGVLTCEIEGDVRLLVGSDKFLTCDYEPRGLPDLLKRRAGYVRELQEGISAQSTDFICWTVLRLHKEGTEKTNSVNIAGDYRLAAPDTINEFKLKEHTLVGGRMQSIALEPRCVAPRAGENIAHKVTRFEIAD